jgi:hypothetical protein
VSSLFGVAMILILISEIFVKDDQTKTLLLYVSLSLGTTGLLLGVLYLMKPGRFRMSGK